jgi:hypothetical protein
MAGRPPHIEWLQNTGERLATVDRRVIELWELCHVDDPVILSAWAAHFRNHYCSDADLPDLVAGTGKAAAEYPVSIKFPDARAAPGPSVRAGDFAEILVADFIEFILGPPPTSVSRGGDWVSRLRRASVRVRRGGTYRRPRRSCNGRGRTGGRPHRTDARAGRPSAGSRGPRRCAWCLRFHAPGSRGRHRRSTANPD